MTPEKAQTMSPSKKTDYDALEATTRIEDITNDEVNQDTLRSLKDDDGELCSLSLVSEDFVDADEGDYHPKSSEELGWLGHFAKKSAHLDGLDVCGSTSDIFENCSEQSIDRFFEVLRSCNKIKRVNVIYTDLADIISKLGPSMNKNITHWGWDVDNCFLGAVEVNQLFTAIQGMENLEEVNLRYNDEDTSRDYDVDDDIMARCIPLLASCTRMRALNIRKLGLRNNSCEAMSAIFSRMAALHELDLSGNLIDDDCVEVLVRGLAECQHLHSLTLFGNMIGDDGLEILIQGLPASVDTLALGWNEIALARQLPLLRFRVLSLTWNFALKHGGPGVIAASLANPECRLEEIDLRDTNIGDEEAAILAPSLRNNQRLIVMHLDENVNITKAGWDAFLPVLCDTTNINATHGSNHTLQCLGLEPHNISRDVQMMLDINHGQDKSRVAADKILQVHRLDMRPLFDRQLDLLPYVITWLSRFTEYHPDPESNPELSSIFDKHIARAPRADLKLSSIFEFVRAMPMEVVNGVAGRKKTKKRRRSSS